MNSLEDALIQIGIWALIIVIVLVTSIIEILKENSDARKNPKKRLPVDEETRRRVDEEMKRKKARATYAEAVRRNKAEAAKKVKNSRKAILCPNCGAPLKTIYTKCNYCGMSYKNASDLAKETIKNDREALNND